MDCKTVRLLLEFVRPRSGEMDSAERAALEQHLAGCPECEAVARAESGLDRAFANAMQAVEVPAGLRTRLMERLEHERRSVNTRWLGRGVRIAAAAAVLMLAAWAGYLWHQSRLPVVDMDAAWDAAHNQIVAPPTAEFLAEHFRGLGYDGPFPRDLEYSFVRYYGMAQFQGRQVPQLIFQSPAGSAEVRVLSAKQFNLTSPPVDYRSPSGYPIGIQLWSDRAGCFEVINYTGESASWLKSQLPPEEAAN